MRTSSIVAGMLCVIGLAACSDSSPDAVSADVSPVTGVYALKSIDGMALPWTDPAHPSDTLISDAVTLNSDGTWQDAVAYASGVSGSDSGTFIISGDSLAGTLNGKTYKGTFTNGTFTLSFDGHVGVFQQF